MKSIFLSVCTLCAFGLFAQNQNPESAKMKRDVTEIWEPEVKVITPSDNNPGPSSDAIVLFDGSSESLLRNWVNEKGEAPGWKVADKCVTVINGAGKIITKSKFEDFQLHIEWRTPAEPNPENKSQTRGNSGIIMQENYELQVLDSYNNRTYSNGQAGSIYKLHSPLVNVSKKPGEWQTYDVVYTAPRFKSDSTLITPARVTVLQNGILVQNNVELLRPTEYIGMPGNKMHSPGSLELQDHINPVSYRNIWIRKL